MMQDIVPKNITDNKSLDECSLSVEIAHECPRCQAHALCQIIFSVLYDYEEVDAKNFRGSTFIGGLIGSAKLTTINFCSTCGKLFFTNYSVPEFGNALSSDFCVGNQHNSEPLECKGKNFEKAITDLSPSFCEIYNQAMASERMNLDQIAGISYRKALEFLVKDYALSHSQDKAAETEIKSMPLSQCINKYLDKTEIKILAQRAAWLGNDEAHYLKKHSDRDINDIKSLIEALLDYISLETTVENATKIPALK